MNILKFSLLFFCTSALAVDPPLQNWLPGEQAPQASAKTLSVSTPPVPALDFSAVPSDVQSGSGNIGTIDMRPPPPVNLLSGKDSRLTNRESANVALAKRWMEGVRPLSDLAAPGDAGTVIFRYGSTLPAVICAPLYVCSIALQPGEAVLSVLVGDPVRWKVTPAISGAANSLTTHVIVKPSDIGLSTNLLVTTDRRAYMLKLVSRETDWMPAVSFSYPEDEAAAWNALVQQQEKHQADTIIPETGQSLDALDFGYRLRGDSPPWRPIRVYTDGLKTYIQFPRAMHSDESPALVALGSDNGEQLVNYRLSGDRYVVDKVLDRALLVAGVGRDQIKVRIDRYAEP